ncbi:MAG: DMT family transporter [Chitinophagaceae bacterium]|nr:DMT family transporter [Polaromonas sp.]
MKRIVAYSCLALSMLLTGSYVALSKPLVAALPVFLLVWLRFGMASAAMLNWLKKPQDESPMTIQTKRLLFLESFLGNFLFSICMLFGVSMTGAVTASVVLATIPAAVALMSWAFLGELIGRRTWAAVICAVLGVTLVSLSKPEFAAPVPVGFEVNSSLYQSVIGTFLLLAAVLCEAAYAVIGKKLVGALGPKRITALINLWGFALMTPLGLWSAWAFDFSTVAAPSWLILVFYSLAASVWTVWLWMTGLKTIPASQAGVFTVFLPVSAATVGVVFLGESLSGLQA